MRSYLALDLQPNLDRGRFRIELKTTRLRIEPDTVRRSLRSRVDILHGFRQFASFEIEFALSRLHSSLSAARNDGRNRAASVGQHEGLFTLDGTFATPIERPRYILESLKTFLREQY